ncbi:ICP22 family protein [Actinomadura macrotermitis]|uniref:DUF308 domain-containing protein n=1 Tax=Actinomadura macrotermitis TaxID=2585200 RepID=A0A7K0BP35_9ACTN|nr:hypothetical protein [Actinomadura macrotermitis]
MNRRGNGLSAQTYAPLVDLAPHLADAMLSALREAGVAAYAAPGTGPAADAPPADDVLDRLYVDVDMKQAAEGVLRVHLTRLRDAGGRAEAEPEGDAPETPARDGSVLENPVLENPVLENLENTAPTPAAERDEDAIWAEIVAGFDAGPAEGDRVPWPDQENIHEPAEPPAEGDDRTGRLPRARVIKAAADEEEFPPADEDGHYVPPPPPPLPSADPLTKGAWIALVGGPVYLLVTVILNWTVPGWAAFLAVAAFIGGFVTLVLRMGDEPRDPDDGAVV